MERRKFLKSTAAVGITTGTLASTFPAPAISRNLRRWRMVTSWPKGLPGLGTGAERLAERISRMSEGRLSVKMYSAGELVPGLGVFDAVANGTADMGHDASFYHMSKTEVAAFFTAFPWGLNASELSGWIYHADGQKLWDELYAPFNLKPFLAGNSGAQMFGWFRKEIKTLEDIKGLRFRVPGNGGKVMSKLGATVVNLSGDKILQALESGTLDAVEWNGPYNDLPLRFHQFAKYYYSPGFHEPGAGLELIVNREKYERLPLSFKEVIRTAAEASNSDIYAEYIAKHGPLLRKLVQEHGVRVLTVPKDILRAAVRAANEVLEEVRANDDISKRIVDSYLKYRKDTVAWTRVGELEYLNARQQHFPHGE